MEIRILKQSGVPQAEIEAHKKIQEEFDSTPFSKHWRGYAAFSLARKGRGAGDDDFDLVLVTHTNIVVIELKNWHGKLLESNGNKWFLDGEDRGSSPVEVAALKAKKLASTMKQKLGPERTPFVSSYVVLHGDIKELRLTDDEERSVLNMAELLTFKYADCYKDYLWGKARFDPTKHLKTYDAFFEGSSFKPKVYYVDGFRPDPEPIFEHPRKLYREFRAAAKDDPNAQALLRQWNFSALGLDMLAEGDRAGIGLREQRVYQYVADRNEELSLALFRPLARKSPKDVTLDFAELFALPSSLIRLTEFTHSLLPKLRPEERLLLVKSLVNRFAELHDLRVAHRDVGDHSVWLDRSAKVMISGFPAAYFPEMRTVGTFRDKVKVEQAILPEDSNNGSDSSPYSRDVFMLGALAYLLLHGEKPPRVAESYSWSPRAEDPFDGTLDDPIRRALQADPDTRFSDAREMLEAINAATADAHEEIVDISAFEAFKPTTKERDYDETHVLHEDESFLCFRSDSDDRSFLVKIWYGVTPDPLKQDRALRLLSFLERCRVLQSVSLPHLQSVVDFGLTRGSILLVLNWAEGKPLSEWLIDGPSIDKRLTAARALTTTVARLHDLELAHGDIHPGNVVVGIDGSPVIIDVADLRLSSSDAYTTAYLPDNYKTLSPFERDRFGLAATLVELLGSSRDKPHTGSLPIPGVYEELANILSAETLSTLQPLIDALEKATRPEQAEPPLFTVTLTNLGSEASGELRSDNGQFHVSAQKDRRSPNSLRVWLTGIGRQLILVWNLSDERLEFARLQSISQSQLLRSQTMRDVGARFRIEVVDGPAADAENLIQNILSIEEIGKKTTEIIAAPVEAISPADEPEQYVDLPSSALKVKSRELWSVLLQAEEESFPSVTVAGETRKNPYRDGQTLIPYHTDGRVIDYDLSDTVIVESQNPDGVWLRCGQLNLRDTTFGQLAELAVEHLHPRANLKIGAPLRLMSVLEKGSLSRRRFAVERILEDKAVVPGLIDYLDPSVNEGLSPSLYSTPADEDLAIYSSEGRELNDSQKDAFRKVLGHGPVSLLQGPPGTGKTWFIACLLHHLITREGVRRVLLVSQSHEAVNNALEKALEICTERGTTFHAVRMGSESATSDGIKHFHSNAIEQAYRERFKAERKERVARLAVAIGLPRRFAEEYVQLHFRLVSLARAADNLNLRMENAADEESASYGARIRALDETFWDIARDVYDVSSGESMQAAISSIEQSLIDSHEVRSKDAVARLGALLRLSDEWIDALGSPDANFSEFLGKTRTIVSGTLVGIGYRASGVIQNIFDWVIIDEAGRAAPSELAVAMQAGHRILLVGDHLQLPPTYPEGVRDEMRRRYNASDESPMFASDFARMFDSEYGSTVGATLLTQYRMAPDIGELVSDCFYSGRLKTGRGEPPEYYDFLPEHLRTQIAWIDTTALGPRALEQFSDDEVNRWNMMEARIVMGLLQQIIEADDFVAFMEADLQPNEPAIGVICMYSKQREIIDKMVSEAVWLENRRRLLKVDTVDSYQGKENRIVILSTVRNNTALKPGFLRSPNRINVAMSRAMERLYIVGAQRMWDGRNADLPLGQVRKRVCEMAAQQRAALLNPELFLVT
jgi:serine/threonine protein kinase